MALTQNAKNYLNKMLAGGAAPKVTETDPEFTDIFDNFAFDEVVNEKPIDDKSRFIAILATLLGCQGVDEFRVMLPAALNFGLTAVEVKEIVYQATAYLGIGRVMPFIKATNEVLVERGVKLPLENQGTTNGENRVEKGEEAQVAIFGDGMRGFSKSGDESVRHINKWLSGNCFGDYYTRGGLNYRERELITFCFLYAQGGCEPQLTAHAKANIRIGNDKAFLISILSNCLPYIGYPRTLNALNVLSMIK